MPPEAPKPQPGDLLIWEQVNGNTIGTCLFLGVSRKSRKTYWALLWEDGEIRLSSPDVLWTPSRILRDDVFITLPSTPNPSL